MKTIHWNVDTQYDFMRDDNSFRGALPVPGAKGIEEKLGELTRLAHKEKRLVVNTADWHNNDSAEFSDDPDYKTTFPPHCLADTKGAHYVLATRPIHDYIVDWRQGVLSLDDLQKAVSQGRDITILKDEFDVFSGNPYTNDIMEVIRPEHAIVYGVAANVCVDYAVKGLRERGVDVTVPLDAVKELLGMDYEKTKQEWKDMGVNLTTVGAIKR